MTNEFLLLVTCLALGTLVARIANPPAQFAQSLNWWVLYIALPATVLHLASRLSLSLDMWFLVASMWLTFAGAWFVFAAIGHWRKWPQGRIGALTLVCGLGNTSFIGYPMIASLRGTEGLPLAVVADQAGCFTMLAIGGALVTSIYGGGGVSVSRIAQRVLLFPPFVALLVGICMGVLGGWLPFVDDSLQRIGATLVPLALFSVGLQVRLQSSSEHAGVAAIGLAYKLAAAPLAIYVIGVISGIGGMMLTIGVLQSAMAPMISAAILAEQHDLEPQLANYVLALGIVLSFATVPLLNSWL